MPARQAQTGEELPPYRGRIEPGARQQDSATYRRKGHRSQSSLPAYERGRDRCLLRPPLYPPAPSEVPGKGDTGFRDDQAFGQYPSGMLRGMCLLYYFRPSGEIHRLAEPRIYFAGSEGHYGDARLQGIPERPRRPIGQYVPYGRKRYYVMRKMPPALVYLAFDMSQPQCRPYGAARTLSCGR